MNRVDPGGLQDELITILCAPVALLPIVKKPGTPECKDRQFKAGCRINRVGVDVRGNCPAGWQRATDTLIVGGKPKYFEYCVKCVDETCTAGRGTCIPCVEEVTIPTPHPLPDEKGGRMDMDKGSKTHNCKCFVPRR